MGYRAAMCEWRIRAAESFWTTGWRHSKLTVNTVAFGLGKPRRNKDAQGEHHED
jgi:hypothetical protein